MRWLIGLSLCGALAGGCNTPSVPLPPPDINALAFMAPQAGTLVLDGGPSPRHDGVLFYVVDETSGDGVIQKAKGDGSFTTEAFAGAAGDLVEIYYEANGERSGTAVCTVSLGVPLGNPGVCQ